MDKWPEVQATVRSVEQFEDIPDRYGDSPRKLADVIFAYDDLQQEHQYGSITVDWNSALYDAKENDTFMVRVNPKQGEKYYSPEATESGY